MSLGGINIDHMISGPLSVAQVHLVYRQDRTFGVSSHAPRIGTAFRAVASRGMRDINCSERSAHAASMRSPVAPVTRVGGHLS